MSKLYRSSDDVIIAGVLGGIGEYFRINTDLLRIVYVIFIIATGSLFLMTALYVLGIIIIPKRNPNEFHTSYTYSNTEYNSDPFSSDNVKDKFRDFSNDFRNRASDIGSNDNAKLFGYILIALGVYFTFSKVLFHSLPKGLTASIALIILGLVLLFKRDRGK